MLENPKKLPKSLKFKRKIFISPEKCDEFQWNFQ